MEDEYEPVICQECNEPGYKDGDCYEVLKGDYPVDHQEWLYCKACDIETFKDMPNED